MKKMLFLLFPIICSCQANKKVISSSPFLVTRKIVSFKENDKVVVLISDKKDIIEVFKGGNDKCMDIKLGKKYTFTVGPVSDMIVYGIESPKEYILNDSTIIKYNHYYSIEDFKNICIQK